MGEMRRKPLQDDAVIVRFGLMEIADLRRSVMRCHAIREFYGLSFFGENGLSVDEIITAAGAPHRWFRASTNGAVRRAGYDLKREGPNNHLVLEFGDLPSDADLGRLERVFDAPRENPHPV